MVSLLFAGIKISTFIVGHLMPKLLTQGECSVPKTGRSLIGMVAGFKSEWWPVFDRNGGRLHVGIRTQAATDFMHAFLRSAVLRLGQFRNFPFFGL
ncbi:hypothetical protein [Rhizobium sp. 007]|uniref:hypothetical protein n=1 Tax=Rhizobium sp. 007 TaxID=2785056 RepID=UPI00188E7E58|nr:hypothetical protein [Rhizobium sp. 007]QPB22631.1 hypothetical protein ISN39_23865 [Rhizobium sp. 007]